MKTDKQLSKRAFQKIRTLYWGTVCLCAPSVSSAQNIESIINRTINYLQGGLHEPLAFFASSLQVTCVWHVKNFLKNIL
ncbi:hypothetical protein ABXK18_00055 [Legionella pneumophila 130b]|uniref:hypothetical protein n=1 Tax=Legionella pneumophila TaxID=446 RepID=UPI00359399E3